MVALDELLAQADFVSLHLPLNEKTYHLLGEREFRLMKPTASLVNTARGPVVDEPALIKALQERWIACAALDVLEQEPPDPDNPLLKMENVIITPHIAGMSRHSMAEMKRRVSAAAAKVLAGSWPAQELYNPRVKGKANLRQQ